MINRSAGVFLNISSLPSDVGIGTFNCVAHRFVDLLGSMNMKWWQILPLCPVGNGNSPYSSVSAFAINPYYIDLESLKDMNLLSPDDIRESKFPGPPYAVDYDFISHSKPKFLRRAFNNFDLSITNDFCKENSFWIYDYAKFMAYKIANNFTPWWVWKNEYDQNDMNFYIFEQYIAYTQWQSVKDYANKNGVSILGDMPIYVARDSADFWSHKENFLCDTDGNLTKIAGVPPDYFSQDGQLWGNPLYNWEQLKADNYSWWIERIGHSLKLYNSVRIDHFSGFHKYWAVDAKAKTARDGCWENGPGIDLFKTVNKTFLNPQIIAEDLGVSDNELVEFLQHTGYPGMRVMQYAFAGDNSQHLPFKYNEKTVAYTGTHDNDTMLGWLWAIPTYEKERLLKYCRFSGDNWGEGGERSDVIRSIITTLWQTTALITVVPIQDICGFGTDTRMNIPGVSDNQWRFRVTSDALSRVDYQFYCELNKTYGR